MLKATVSKSQSDEPSRRVRRLAKSLPRLLKRWLDPVTRGKRRVARLLLPKRNDVQDHRYECGPLNNLDQFDLTKMRKKRAVGQRPTNHAQK